MTYDDHRDALTEIGGAWGCAALAAIIALVVEMVYLIWRTFL